MTRAAAPWLALLVVGCSSAVDGNAGVTSTGPASSVASVQMGMIQASVPVGGTVQLQASPKSSSGTSVAARSVLWASDAPAVATVNQNALVTGVSAGTAHVTVTMDGHVGMTTVTVTAQLTGR